MYAAGGSLEHLLDQRTETLLFKSHILDQIASGRVTVAFRYWSRPSVTARGTLRTPVGILAIDSLAAITPSEISDADALCAGFENREKLMSALQSSAGRVLYRIDFHIVGDDPRIALRQDAELSNADTTALIERLAHMDRTSKRGPWTDTALSLIAGKEGRTAAEIAQALSVEKPTLKRRIRQLKELGLTESLESGYRLSPRGAKLWSELKGRS